jgi:excisionase family DNA binding protein
MRVPLMADRLSPRPAASTEPGPLMKPDKTAQPTPPLSSQQSLRLPRFLSVEAVATQLEVSTKTVRRWIDSGELPVHRFGRQLRVSEADLGAFIARSRSS